MLPSSHPPEASREFIAGMREIAPALLGTMPFGFVAGVAAVGAGMNPLEAIALSIIVFSGIAQLVVAQLVAAQAPVFVILAAVTVVSLRHLMYSAALSPHLAHLPARWRLLLAYLMTDQSFALGVKRFGEPGERAQRHFYVLGVASTLFVAWQFSVALGALAGAQVPANWSLDFVVTLTFLGLLVPALRTRADIAAATVASATALVAAGLPYKLALVAASLAGIGAGVAAERAGRR
ncbi:MAG TPA: AzlC family ABC transporter permease [Usitatibacteraceae bacterium]|nr:AzlC family ABC transporter permease [Usitatibacteraceae bacterium]